jgi:DNA-binding XRE family transcriptional regulator
MSVALKIQEKVGKKVDLKLIKKIVKAYEEVSSDEFVTVEQFDEMLQKQFPSGISASEKIKALRVRQGLTQKMLAEKSQIAQQNISEIERGKRHPGKDVFSELRRKPMRQKKAFSLVTSVSVFSINLDPIF